jgi:segregation and condensation protein B
MSHNPTAPPANLKQIIEAALLAAGEPLSVAQIAALFDEAERPGNEDIGKALDELTADCADRGVELKKVASGYRLQVKPGLQEWISRLWSERPQRYSRAMLETLALVAYRQPITRGEVEEVRGVSLSSNIIRTLQERDWIRVVGHRDVPGKPALFGTTRTFLDYFNLESLDELPTLAEIKDMETLEPELDFEAPLARPDRTENQEDGDPAEANEEASTASSGAASA